MELVDDSESYLKELVHGDDFTYKNLSKDFELNRKRIAKINGLMKIVSEAPNMENEGYTINNK